MMKKIITFTLISAMLILSGCEKVADRITPEDKESDIPVTAEPERKNGENGETLKRIVISKTLKMTNEWTIMGDYNCKITKDGEDRVLLATSAIPDGGEMQWDDSQYWTLAVLTKDGAYNLFYERVSGMVYAEVNEAYVQGVATTIITAYIFSGGDREIRNYTYSYNEDAFIEEQVFSTRLFSTGGVSNLYSTFPEYKAR